MSSGPANGDNPNNPTSPNRLDGFSSTLVARQIGDVWAAMETTVGFFLGSGWMQRAGQPGVADFVVGNPQEGALPEFVRALQTWAEPRSNDWFAYKMSEPKSRQVVATNLRERRGVPFEPDDIAMTNGGFAALAVCLRAVVEPGDEVIYVTPPWFFYKAIVVGCGGVPVEVPADPETFDLDVEAIARAITPRTRAVIVNSPHNPTGRLYQPDTLAALGRALTDASRRNGRPIFLLSDEAFHRIVFDGRAFTSPTEHYPHSFAIYTYGKTLLTPGARLGWIALPPTMPLADRKQLRMALTVAQMACGYAFPDALLQHAIAEIDALTIDIAHLQRKRDHVVSALRAQGYQTLLPEGTIFVLVRSPLADDLAFCQRLAERDVFVLPGAVAGAPGWFRVSLTANDEMIERALPIFAEAIAEARAGTVGTAIASD
jgi:aspartate aminotransferase